MDITENSVICSIIIPTRNRVQRLLDTLNAYRKVRKIAAAEIIVVDDGSSDRMDDLETHLPPNFPCRVRVLFQSPKGPAAARNLGVRMSAAPLVIFTGDDIVPSETFLEEHLAAHQRHPEEPAAVLGKTLTPASDLSAFMSFLTYTSDLQFGYTDLDRGIAPDHRHFYTSNLSLKKSFLIQEPGPFDERFTDAAWEDVDVGYRLSLRGLKIQYAPDALATHHHSHTFSQFRSRQERSGRMAFRFAQKHPNLARRMFLAQPSWIHRMFRESPDLTRLFLSAAESLGFSGIARRLYPILLSESFWRGWFAERSDVASAAIDPGIRGAVVVVNWNGLSFLEVCLPALLASLPSGWDVYVVDNGSTDGSSPYIRSRFPAIRLIELRENAGFAKANNIAMREILGKADVGYIALLNNDTRPDRNWITELVKVMQADPGFGMAAPKILRMDDPTLIDSTGHEFQWGRMIDRGGGVRDVGQYNRPGLVIGACAAACLYRAAMLSEVGLFDESFGSYYEDVDLSWRANRAGWAAAYVPTSVVHHKRGGTTWRDSQTGRALMRRAMINQAVCVARHAAFLQKSAFWIRQTIGLIYGPLRAAFGGPPANFGVRLSSWIWTLLTLLGRSPRPAAASNPRVRFICHVVSKLGIGGAEKNLLLLTRNLPKDKFASVVLSLNGEGAYAGRLRQAGVPVYSLGLPHPKGIWHLFRFLVSCPFDLFHGHMFHGNLAARFLAAALGRPAISAVRVAEGEKRWHVWVDRVTSALVDRYTANSKSLAEFVEKEKLAPASRVTVIPNALSREDFENLPTRDEARARLGVPPRVTLVAMVGRLHIQKDPETFVRAAKLILSSTDNPHFLIAGIGPLRSKLERQIADAGLSDRFHLAGLVEARFVYAACDVFVLPSRWEGFPNAAIEAMAAGCPAVLSDFPGAEEVVDYGVTGLIFPRGDERALSEAVVGLLRNESRRREMGRKARETVLSRYTEDRLVSGNVTLYEQLTGSAGAK